MKKYNKLIIATIVVLLIVVGVVYNNKNNNNSSVNKSENKESSQKVVKVGAILGLTGEAASYGQGAQKGIEIAVEKIKKEKNIDIQVVYEDSQMDPKKAVSSFQKLTSMQGVNYVTTMSSGEMLAICPLAESNKDILIGPGSSPAITNCGDYTFRDMPSDSFQGKEIAKQLYIRNIKKVVIMYINNEYGVGVKGEFEKNFQGEIVAFEAHNPKEVDFRTQLLKVKNLNPEAIILVSQLAEGSNILKQKAELGITQDVYTSEGLKDDNLLKNVSIEALKNVYFFSPASYSGKENLEYKESYKKKYGEDYAAFSDYMSDAIIILAEAIDKCEKPEDVQCIKDNLYKVNITGATGPIKLDSNGDILDKKYDLYKTESSHFTVVK